MPNVLPKIVVRLIGGLGNQLFQFLKMIDIVEKTGETDVAFDSSFYKGGPKSHEKITFTKLFDEFKIIDLDNYENYHWRYSRFIARLLWKFNFNRYELNHIKYVFQNQTIIKYKKDSLYVVDGFWQDAKEINESAVTKIRVALKEEFKGDSRHYLNNILSSESVCVHIRRGDYLTNRHLFRRQQDVLPLNYYKKAFEKLDKELINAHYFIFSDDIEWVKQNFKENENYSFVESNNNGPIATLYLMSMCKHFIIANSSFSWWAAMIAENHKKRLIAPNPWQKKSEGSAILLNKFDLIDW